jgi:hypothetical protein
LPGASTIEDYALAGIEGDLTPRARRSRMDRDSDLADDEFDYERKYPRFGPVRGGFWWGVVG